MYYSSGNYEAFATPKKPEGIDNNYIHFTPYSLFNDLFLLNSHHSTRNIVIQRKHYGCWLSNIKAWQKRCIWE